MATTYKVLGQSAPSANSDTTLYTVPAATSAVLSTINIANRGSTAASFRIAIRPAGASLVDQHYIAYGVPIAAVDSIALTLGFSLAATDVVTIRASTNDLSFSAFGAEIT